VHAVAFALLLMAGRAGVDYEGIMRSMRTTGYQATNLGLAVEEVSCGMLCCAAVQHTLQRRRSHR
jgi:hypothetical protein